MADHDTRAAAREAAAVQAVELAGTLCLVAVAVVLQVAQRYASEPDFVPRLQARAKLARRQIARRAEARLARLGIWALAQAERQRSVADA